MQLSIPITLLHKIKNYFSMFIHVYTKFISLLTILFSFTLSSYYTYTYDYQYIGIQLRDFIKYIITPNLHVCDVICYLLTDIPIKFSVMKIH